MRYPLLLVLFLVGCTGKPGTITTRIPYPQEGHLKDIVTKCDDPNKVERDLIITESKPSVWSSMRYNWGVKLIVKCNVAGIPATFEVNGLAFGNSTIRTEE